MHERANKFVTGTAKGDLFLFFHPPEHFYFNFKKSRKINLPAWSKDEGHWTTKSSSPANEKTLHTRVDWAEESIVSYIFWWSNEADLGGGAATAGKDATVEENNNIGAIVEKKDKERWAREVLWKTLE